MTSETPRIILDETTRRPLMMCLADGILYAFQQGVEAQVDHAECATDPCVRDSCAAAEAQVDRLNQEIKQLQDALLTAEWNESEAMALVFNHEGHIAKMKAELDRVNRARERAYKLMSAKIQRQKGDLRRMYSIIEENKRLNTELNQASHDACDMALIGHLHGAEGLKDAVAKARKDQLELCISVIAKHLGKFASNSAANALVAELESASEVV